jgi:hypothetical protein
MRIDNPMKCWYLTFCQMWHLNSDPLYMAIFIY